MLEQIVVPYLCSCAFMHCLTCSEFRKWPTYALREEDEDFLFVAPPPPEWASRAENIMWQNSSTSTDPLWEALGILLLCDMGETPVKRTRGRQVCAFPKSGNWELDCSEYNKTENCKCETPLGMRVACLRPVGNKMWLLCSTMELRVNSWCGRNRPSPALSTTSSSL